MKVFIVHAHHEPQSFNGALTRLAQQVLTEAGHEVQVSDLYAMKFDPVSDRRNFTTIKDSNFLNQQAEEQFATDNHSFAPEIEAELQKLEWCDVLIFQFPLWWFGMPGVLKGWIDKVLAFGRVYGGGKWYENGIGKGKRALVSMTTGGPEAMYSGFGLNPKMTDLLIPIHHGVFWFNGFQPLPPFIAWGARRVSPEQRTAYLEQYRNRLLTLDTIEPIYHFPTTEFDDSLMDPHQRFMVSWTRTTEPDDQFYTLVAAEREALHHLKNTGKYLSGWIAEDRSRGWLMMRETSEAALREHLERLPLAPYLHFEITVTAKE